MGDDAVRDQAKLDDRGRFASYRAVVAGAWTVLNRAIDLLGVIVLLGLIGIVVLQIYHRYVLGAALDWPEEVARWGFVWLVFVGTAVVQRDRGHISIEFLSTPLFSSPRRALAHHVFVTAIITATCLWMARFGLEMVSVATMRSAAMDWPFAALLAAVPVGAAMTIVYLLFDSGGRSAVAWSRGRILLANAVGIGLGVVIQFVALNAAGVWSAVSPATLLIVASFALIALGVPIAHAMIFATFVALSPQGDLLLMTVSQSLTGSLNSFIILAVPFYIFAAALMNVGGVTTRLIDLAGLIVGRVRGGIAYVNVVTNAMMAGISGSAVADAAALSKMLVKPMEDNGFRRGFACALTASASTMAHLIPPSIGLIIYGALASASVGALFVAGIVPGLLVAVALLLATFLTARKLPVTELRESVRHLGRGRVLARALPALALPVAIVGGVRAGLYTATEAGAMAAAYALLLGAAVFRELSWRDILPTARSVVVDTITVVFLVAAAAPFAWTLATEQVPQSIAAAISHISDNPVVLLIMINVFLLAVGCFMDMIAAMVILVPIFLPIIKAAGVDPIQFGVIVVLNLIIGGLTPPFGIVAFVAARVGKAPIAEVFRAITPFFFALLAVLFVVTYFPAISLSLVRLFGP